MSHDDHADLARLDVAAERGRVRGAAARRGSAGHPPHRRLQRRVPASPRRRRRGGVHHDHDVDVVGGHRALRRRGAHRSGGAGEGARAADTVRRAFGALRRVVGAVTNVRYTAFMTRQIVLWGAAGGILIALLQMIEYKNFIHEYPSEVYGILVALIFTAVGIYLGLKWTRPREVVVVKEVPVRGGGPFTLDEARPREGGRPR